MLSFRRMRASDQEMVMRWRTQPDVAKFMLTEIEFNMENQRRWFERVDRSATDEYWIIENAGAPAGVINLSEIDRANRHATWGLYLGEKLDTPAGGMIPIYFYNYVFAREDLNLHKLHGMVLETNTSMLRMHETCGYREVGRHVDHVLRDGRFLDVLVVELLRDTWLARGKRFAKCVAPFEGPPARPHLA